MPAQRAYVRYSDAVEQRLPDEEETVERIIASMTRESETTPGATAAPCAPRTPRAPAC
jgi:hypothetical protein